MSSSQQIQTEFALLIRVIKQTNDYHISSVAAAVWVFYDIIITLDDEVQRMWKGRLLTIPTITYAVCRYFGLFFLVYNICVLLNTGRSDALCRGFGAFEAFGVQLLSMLTNMLLAVRVDAFYQGNRLVRWTVGISYFAETAIELAISTLSGVLSGTPAPFPAGIPITGCTAEANVRVPRLQLVAWTFNLAYQVLCLALIVRRFYSEYRQGLLTNDLARAFFRDGIFFFCTVGAANLVNLILVAARPASPIEVIGTPWLIAAFSVAVSRMILSLRGAGKKGTGFTSEYERTRSQPGPLVFAMNRMANRPARHDMSTVGEYDLDEPVFGAVADAEGCITSPSGVATDAELRASDRYRENPTDTLGKSKHACNVASGSN